MALTFSWSWHVYVPVERLYVSTSGGGRVNLTPSPPDAGRMGENPHQLTPPLCLLKIKNSEHTQLHSEADTGGVGGEGGGQRSMPENA